MKHNTEQIMSLLAQAIKVMPQDFALAEARYHLTAAYQQIEKVESRRVKRAEQEKIQNEYHWPTTQGVNIKETLDAIDGMIAAEQKKIDDIKTKRQRANNDDDISPILG